MKDACHDYDNFVGYFFNVHGEQNRCIPAFRDFSGSRSLFGPYCRLSDDTGIDLYNQTVRKRGKIIMNYLHMELLWIS